MITQNAVNNMQNSLFFQNLEESLFAISDLELEEFINKNDDLTPLTIMCSQCM